jgi:hypothetical protein
VKETDKNSDTEKSKHKTLRPPLATTHPLPSIIVNLTCSAHRARVLVPHCRERNADDFAGLFRVPPTSRNIRPRDNNNNGNDDDKKIANDE